MKNYVSKLLLQVGHEPPVKKQLSHYRCTEIMYGRKLKQAPEQDSSPALYEKGFIRVQRIFGALLYYSRAVNNKLLVSLSAIGSHQASATEKILK